MTVPLYTPEIFLNELTSRAIPHTLFHHPAVFTVAESEAIDAKIPGFHTRNMFLKDKKDTMFLVTLGAHDKIDLKKLEGVLGCGRLSFGSPERLMKYLGVTPGSVTPLAILNDTACAVTQILDERMMRQEVINMHPLINTMTVSLTPKDLLTVIAMRGVSPRIVDLSAAAPI
jgi:Ala-tRNA(Pro) deacylase